MDYVDFERRLLRLIFRTNTPLTPVHVAYHLEIPIAEAKAHLDGMVTAGVLELDSDEQGHLEYGCPGRPPIATLPPPAPARRRKRKPRSRREGRALIRIDEISTPPLPTSLPAPSPFRRRQSHVMLTPITHTAHAAISTDPTDDRRYSAAAAAALSFFLPGVGQIYSGRVPQGIGWMIATGMGYLLFLVPGLILHICCIVNAAAVPTRIPALLTSSPSAR
jgi:TM2 domain-containing membrane protein YozV